MAAPTYTTDLSDIDLCDGASSYVEFVGWAQGDGGAEESDWYLQGTSCASDEANNKTGIGHSLVVTGNVTFATGEVTLAWMQCQAGNAMDVFANGGYAMIFGSSLTTWEAFWVGGSDFGRNPYGGWTNVVADPAYPTPDLATGTTTAYRYFGVGFNLVATIGKGRPLNMDAVRSGRGILYIANGSPSVSANFADAASANDSTTNRWGLFQAIAGGYLWKGMLSFGSAATSVDFEDSNVNISIDDTPRTYSNFNRIEFRNATSVISWNAVQIAALGTAAAGNLEMIDNCFFSATNCSFTDMGTFTLQSNADTLNCTWRRTDTVTQGGAFIDGCTFDNCRGSASIDSNDVDEICNCTFISDGSNHAIKLLGAHAGGSFELIGTSFTGYATVDGSTGNEVIYNDSSGAVTLTVCAGSTPSVRNGGTSSTVIIAGAIGVTVNTVDPAGSAIESSRVLLQASDGAGPFPYLDVVESITFVGTSATVTHSAHGTDTGDKVNIQGVTNHQVYNGVQTITKLTDETYSYILNSAPATNATGSITSTFVALEGLTSVTGGVSTSRVYPSTQNVSGWARKSTSAPYYKTAPLVGTIQTTADFTAVGVMITDE